MTIFKTDVAKNPNILNFIFNLYLIYYPYKHNIQLLEFERALTEVLADQAAHTQNFFLILTEMSSTNSLTMDNSSHA